MSAKKQQYDPGTIFEIERWQIDDFVARLFEGIEEIKAGVDRDEIENGIGTIELVILDLHRIAYN
jgi:hypothetical protein